MFDVLLGRGFAGKCKSLVVKLRSRLLMVKSKKKAVLGYLKKDMAELLRGGSDENAFNRVEGYMVELYRATCYDLIGEFCDCLYKHLSTMQKQAECPDEVKEAVSSLMYAAARISELPELCSLRDLFSEKYGSSLDAFVNEEFVEKIASKAPSMDKKLQIMQDVCKELSVKWDLKACQQKISTPSTITYVEPPKARPLKSGEDGALKEDKKTSPRGKDVLPTVRSHSPRKEIKQMEKDISDEKIAYSTRRRDLRSDPPYAKEIKQEQPTSQQILTKSKDDADKKENISRNESELPSRFRYTPRKENNMGRRDVFVEQEIPRSRTPDESSDLRYARKEQTISINKIHHHGDTDDYNHRQPIIGQSKGTENPLLSRVIPPPYVRPNKIANNRGVSHVVADRIEPTGIPKEGSDVRAPKDSHLTNHGRTVNRYDRDEKDHHEEIVVKEILVKEIKSKPISVRRKFVQSSPVDEVVDKYPDAAQSYPAEKIDLRKMAYPKAVVEDEEEKVMDKLLIHYSKKTLDEDGLTGLKGRRAPPSLSNAGTNNREARIVERIHSPPSHAPHRITSLPTEHPPEVVKLATRAASFGSDNRPHVHPKLPDYDDLAARFAALKAK